MQYSISHKPSSRGGLSSVLATAAAVALLLALAASSAKAEATPAGGLTGLTEGSSASTEAATVPAEVPAAPVDTPESVEAPADVEPAATGGEVASEVTKSEPVTASAPTPAESPSAPTAVPVATPDLIRTASTAVETAAAGVDSVREGVQSEIAHPAADRVAAAGHGHTPPHHPLRKANKVLRHGTQGLVAPDRVQNLLPPARVLAEGPDLGVFSSPVQPGSPSAAPELPSAPPQPIGPRLNQRATVLDRLFIQRITDFGGIEPGGIEPLRLMLGRAGFSAGQQASLASPDAAVTSLVGGAASSRDTAPDRNGNQPIPVPSLPAPQVGASGAAPSSFIPIVVLLALLALAAPAIRRRPWEGPVCSPPVPFVCALERPG